MSKPSRPSICKQFAASAASLAALSALTGCLSPRAGQDETTDVVLTGDSTAGETGPGETGTTRGELMTTTEDPDESTVDPPGTSDDEDTSDPDTSGSTTQVIPPNCGNGEKEGDEECDNGDNNANDAACTLDCHNAFCGDGYVQANVEVCDDKVNDGSYNGCNDGCASFAARCGDGEIQPTEGEECDSSSPNSGCLMGECKNAASCLEIKDSWDAAALDGEYQIWPKQVALDVYCDMTTDGGGYTFVKVAPGESTHAKLAETTCGAMGLQLLVPRTPGHLASAAAVAFDAGITPGMGQNPADPRDYLKIFGVYPATVGESCVGQPLNSEACAEWEASDEAAYWITSTPVGGQPSASNCAKCSAAYYWTGMALTGYEVIKGPESNGAESTHFLCDVGDKRPMN